MPCKIDHDDPDCIPQFLCATCNPRDPNKAAEHAAQHRAAVDRRIEIDKLRRALHKATGQLAAIQRRGDPPQGTPQYRAAQSLPRKIAEIETKLAELLK